MSIPVRHLFGVPISALTMADALRAVDEAIGSRQTLQIGVVNAAKLVNMRRDETLRQSVLSSTIVLADGTAVVWASRLLGPPLPERVAGIDLMIGMLAAGNNRGYRVYCLGATPAVLEQAVGRIRRDYPGVVIAGAHHGYFAAAHEETVAADIAAAAPDILFVAMTSPRKEQFLATWSARLHVPVCHGVGGSFDVLAGVVRRAPVAWQRLGLEWLYRVKQEPRRLWRRYLVTNLLFVEMVCVELLSRQLSRLPLSTSKRA